MTYFRKIWTPELDEWLMNHKAMNRKESYELFQKEFPQITDVSFQAYNTERSRIGAVIKNNPHCSTLAKPIGSEQIKKGYVRIKIAQPNVWIQKQTYIWNLNHPEDKAVRKKDNVIFLDCNNRNFSPDNLMKVPVRVMIKINSGQHGSLIPGEPEHNRNIIQMAINAMKVYDRAENLGLVYITTKKGGSKNRVLRSDVHKSYEAMIARLEKEGKLHEYYQKKYRELKSNPEKYAEQLKRNRERRKKKL